MGNSVFSISTLVKLILGQWRHAILIIINNNSSFILTADNPQLIHTWGPLQFLQPLPPFLSFLFFYHPFAKSYFFKMLLKMSNCRM